MVIANYWADHWLRSAAGDRDWHDQPESIWAELFTREQILSPDGEMLNPS